MRSGMTRVIQGFTQFYLPPNMPLLPSRRASPPFGWYSLRLRTDGWPGCVDLGGWLDRDKFPTLVVEPRYGHPSHGAAHVRTWHPSTCQYESYTQVYSVRVFWTAFSVPCLSFVFWLLSVLRFVAMRSVCSSVHGVWSGLSSFLRERRVGPLHNENFRVSVCAADTTKCYFNDVMIWCSTSCAVPDYRTD